VFPGTDINANLADNEEAGMPVRRLTFADPRSICEYSRRWKTPTPKSDSNLKLRDFNA